MSVFFLMKYDTPPFDLNSPARYKSLPNKMLRARAPLFQREGPEVSSKKQTVKTTDFIHRSEINRTVLRFGYRLISAGPHIMCISELGRSDIPV